MTLIDFDKKELLDIYRALQYTRFEECPVPHDDEYQGEFDGQEYDA